MRVEPRISEGSADLCLSCPLAVDVVADYINISNGRIRNILPFSGSDVAILIDVSLNLDKNHFPVLLSRAIRSGIKHSHPEVECREPPRGVGIRPFQPGLHPLEY
jgi:hypothetical protein